MAKLIINFAPTGIKPIKNWTPYVPITPNEIIEQVHEIYDLGVTIVHLHARDSKTGKPDYKASIYEKLINGVRKHCKDIVISLSTSGRCFPEFERRSEVLELKPDMASLTMSSLNFLHDSHLNTPDTINRLADKMNEMGVHAELECFDSGMINYAKYLINKSILKPPLYWNLLFGNIFTAQPDLATVGLTIRDLPPGSIYALAGLGAAQLKMSTYAIASGAPGVRIGIEDNVYFDENKTVFATNLMLVKRIHQIAEIFEREIMKPSEFGAMGFYNSKSEKSYKNSILGANNKNELHRS
jgi:3-keto-5-aminohexanoate cleavage enzyme